MLVILKEKSIAKVDLTKVTYESTGPSMMFERWRERVTSSKESEKK
jgi:hypothetical protein